MDEQEQSSFSETDFENPAEVSPDDYPAEDAAPVADWDAFIPQVAEEGDDDPFAEADEDDSEGDSPGGEADDPWQSFLDETRELAASYGYDTPEQLFAAQAEAVQQQQIAAAQEQANTQWLSGTAQELAQQYQQHVDSGALSPEQASALYQRDLQNIVYERQRQEAEIDLSSREIQQHYHAATQHNPLLGLDNGIAGSLIEGLSLSGLLPKEAATEVLSSFANAIAQHAVAQHVAMEAQRYKNAAPVIPAGWGAPTAPTQPENTSDWGSYLLRRSGIGREH